MKILNILRRRTLPLLVGLLGAIFITTACSSAEPAPAPTPAAQPAPPAAAPAPAAPRQPVTVKIQDNTFETNWIENAIVKFIVEKGYGDKVEEIIVNTVAGMTALQRGDIDVNIEMWPATMEPWHKEQLAAGTIVKLGNIYGGGEQYWLIPKWVAEQHNIKTIEDLKRPEVVKLFPDPENPKKGVFFNCPIGWQCQASNLSKFKAYGLDKFYNVTEAGTAVALDAALVGAMKKKQPVFGYYWAPTSIYGGYDWHILEEPAWTQECADEIAKAVVALSKGDTKYVAPMACAYATDPVEVVASKRFVDKAPAELLDFFKKINVGTQQVSQTAAWAVENDIQGKWEKAAVYYLKTFEDRWKTWVPEQVYQKVKAVLAQAG